MIKIKVKMQFYLLLIIFIILFENFVLSESEEGKVEEWRDEFEADKLIPIRDPNKIASYLSGIHKNIKIFASRIPKQNWIELQYFFSENIDKHLLEKFIDGCQFSKKFDENNELRKMHENVQNMQNEFRKILWEEAKEKNRAKLLRMAEFALNLFEPNNSEDEIHCYGPILGFDEIDEETQSNEYKVTRNVVEIGEILNNFVNITDSFLDSEWERRIHLQEYDPFEIIFMENEREKKRRQEFETGAKPKLSRWIKNGPFELRYHFWRCVKRFEEFEEKYWDYIQFHHPMLEEFLEEAKSLIERIRTVLVEGIAEKREILEPTTAFIRNYFEPNEEHVKKCIFKILRLNSLNYQQIDEPKLANPLEIDPFEFNLEA